MKRTAALALIGLAWAMPASAEVNAFKSVQVDNSAGGAELAGYVTNDILIDFTGQWTGAQALMDPFDAGSIYQHPWDVITPPGSGGVDVDPALAFDTFLAAGSRLPDDGPRPQVDVVPGGGAVDLGGCQCEHKFDDRDIDVAWGPGGGEFITDQTDFLIMRLTLRNDVNGTAAFLTSAGGEISAITGFIHDGALSFLPFVPEPAAAVLALVAATGLGGTRWPTRSRRRRS